jgi:hypothetical protein
MEIIKSRYGSERSLERVDFQRIRVMGEALFTRTSKNEAGEITMYDFEGGPAYTVGMKMTFEGLNYKIEKIVPMENQYKDLCEVVLQVKQVYER